MNEKLKLISKFFVWVAISCALFYGLSRLYYFTTGGFTLGNITYELPFNPRWETTTPSSAQIGQLETILKQNFYYLGKGCQSYVFESEDGNYVIKFMKYQRFRPRPWLKYLTFIPGVSHHLQRKIAQKKDKLDGVFASWKIAYEYLSAETGVLYVHLNKSKDLNRILSIYDKMGLQHLLEIDNYEFLIQRKANMLCPTINAWMAAGDVEASKSLITQLLNRIVHEYELGYADNDHALMQNTGVLDRQPVHVDVGQFVRNKRILDPAIRHQELFNKTWKFRIWLEKHHPLLAQHVVNYLKNYIGEAKFSQLAPRLNKAEMGVLSHQSK